MGGPGRRQPRHIAQIVASISQKRHRARDDAKPSLDQDEDQIQDRAYRKGRAEIDRGGMVVVAQVKAVPMIMVMMVVTMMVMMLMPMPVIMVMIVVMPMIVVIMIMRVGAGCSAGHGA